MNTKAGRPHLPLQLIGSLDGLDGGPPVNRRLRLSRLPCRLMPRDSRLSDLGCFPHAPSFR